MSNDNNQDNSESPQPLHGKKVKKYGSKDEVFFGEAIQTAGGLRKDDLIENKRGKIVSKKKSEHGQIAIQNIKKYQEEHKKDLPIENDSSEHDENEEQEEKIIESEKKLKSNIPPGPVANISDNPMFPQNIQPNQSPVDMKLKITADDEKLPEKIKKTKLVAKRVF